MNGKKIMKKTVKAKRQMHPKHLPPKLPTIFISNFFSHNPGVCAVSLYVVGSSPAHCYYSNLVQRNRMGRIYSNIPSYRTSTFTSQFSKTILNSKV